MKISSKSGENFFVFFIGVLCSYIYLRLAILSNTNNGVEVFDFLGHYFTIAAIVFSYWWYLRHHQLRLATFQLIFWATIFRGIGVFGSPILEDDFYRYLLDGCVFVFDGSPYGITPQSLFQQNALSEDCRQALNWVNNPDLPTIYGPTLQYLFALAHLISPADVTVLQILFALFDLGLILILLRIAPANHVMLYAWSPLALKEIAFTAHSDIVGVFFLFAAVIALHKGYLKTTCLFCGVAFAGKILAIVIIPFLIFRLGIRYWLLTLGTILALYGPFLLQDKGEFFVLGIFAQHWLFNASGFAFAKLFFPDQLARILCISLFAVIWLVYFYRFHYPKPDKPTANFNIPAGDWIFGVFFLLSPVFNAWYLIWLLPFAVIRPRLWSWTLSVAVSLTYLTGLNLMESDLYAYEIAPPAFFIELIAVVMAIIIDVIRHRKSRKPAIV